MEKTNNLLLIAILVLGAFILGAFGQPFVDMEGAMMHDGSDVISMEDMEEHRTAYVEHKDAMVGEMLASSNYRCCLLKPCTYCIEKTPGHGVGATCDCLTDIVEGRHPCGECIGEILEGHGNPYLAEYFAVAIAEEVGVQHADVLREIIANKYDFPIEKQL